MTNLFKPRVKYGGLFPLYRDSFLRRLEGTGKQRAADKLMERKLVFIHFEAGALALMNLTYYYSRVRIKIKREH